MYIYDVSFNGCLYVVDSGFIVFNLDNYLLLSWLFVEFGVDLQFIIMSFVVYDEVSGFEYGIIIVDVLFCQCCNLFLLVFYGMVCDFIWFYCELLVLLQIIDVGLMLGDYLCEYCYGVMFCDCYIVLMVLVLWFLFSDKVFDFFVCYFVQFMVNYYMLQIEGWLQWCVVCGGFVCYVDVLCWCWNVIECFVCFVYEVYCYDDGVEVVSLFGSECYDQVVLVCYSDEVLVMLVVLILVECEVFGVICYQENDMVLYIDMCLLLYWCKVWLVWNVFIFVLFIVVCMVIYCMNLLQLLDVCDIFCVLFNCIDCIDLDKILCCMCYVYLEYSYVLVVVQQCKGEI